MEAALTELAQHGLDGLKISRIAAAAEVNKTSVYRRWPTRQALVAAALGGALVQITQEIEDTGSLEGDIDQLITLVTRRLETPAGRALMQAGLADESSHVVKAVSTNPAVREQEAIVSLIVRAQERGEWDPAISAPDAVFAMLTGSLIHRVMLERQPLTPAWRRTVIDVLCRGVRPPPA